MSLPNEIHIDGIAFRRVHPIPNRISSYCMYDCFLFRPTRGRTVMDVVADWQWEYDHPEERYGRPFICPVRILYNEEVLRQVGTMAYRPDEALAWAATVGADPDAVRLLAERP